MSRVNYDIVYVAADRLVIRDLGPWDKFLSVTNAAEDVVQQLLHRLDRHDRLPGEDRWRKLFYYDTEGQLDQMLITPEGKFGGFKSGAQDRTRRDREVGLLQKMRNEVEQYVNTQDGMRPGQTQLIHWRAVLDTVILGKEVG